MLAVLYNSAGELLKPYGKVIIFYNKYRLLMHFLQNPIGLHSY